MSGDLASGCEAVSGMQRRPWALREVDADIARRLQAGLGVTAVTARVLAGRGLDSVAAAEGFLVPSLDGLHDPFLFVSMAPAVDRLRRALGAGEKIVIHGDYDVDGITATVLLVTVLRHLGGNVGFVLPHRVDDGYGLTPAGVEKAHAVSAGVLICVDCGITGQEACARAVELGIDVIIVDHHLPQSELPVAAAIINPRVEGSGYPEEDLAAVGLAFKLARALLATGRTTASGLSLLKLVALGTVADLVPLRGENRTMTFHGLASLSEAVNPGLLELMKVSGVDPARVTASDVGFRLAPRINAAGRIGHPNEAAELFLTADPGEARRLAGHLQRLNSERQEMERAVFEQAVAGDLRDDDPIVVVWGEGWHRGVIGIVASRLVERYGRPALAISVEGDTAHGSARSVPGFDIVAALGKAADLLGRYGGHKQAAGFELAATHLPDLRAALIGAAESLDSDGPQVRLVCDDVLDPEQISLDLALELDRLAPFGIGNPRPRFLCEGVRLAGPPRLLKDTHVKLMLRAEGGDSIEAVGWGRADLVDALAGAETLSLVATLKVRRWGGRVQPQLEIQDARA